MTTPTDMKSKKDLTMQIQRIRAVHGRTDFTAAHKILSFSTTIT